MNKNLIKNFLVCAVFFVFALFISGCTGSITTPGASGTTSSNGVLAVLVLGPSPEGKDFSFPDKGGYAPLSGVRVSVLGYDLYSTTNSGGYATIDNVPAGTYTVTVGKEGYQANIYSNVVVGGGATTQVGPATGIEIPASTTPYILDLSALSGNGGESITITGVNFGSTQGLSTITFNGSSVTSVTSWSSTSIVCAVPIGATTGNIVVTVGGTASNGVSFTVSSKIIIGGVFSDYNFVNRQKIARLNSDGTLDTSLDPVLGPNNMIKSVAIQSNGKILIGGMFQDYNGTLRERIARINSDGALDTSFDPSAGANNTINSIAIQSDGKILIGGAFSNYNDIARNRIARINTDGSLDTSFDPGAGASDTVNSIAIQSDGKILIGGDFTTYNGEDRGKIARLNSDGSIDASFVPAGPGLNGTVYSIAVQSNGKVLVGGAFSDYNFTTRGKIARLNSDGSLDASFAPAGPGLNGTVYSVAIQSNGKILTGGAFTDYNFTTQGRIARLASDGSLDTSFIPTGLGLNDIVYSIAIQ